MRNRRENLKPFVIPVNLAMRMLSKNRATNGAEIDLKFQQIKIEKMSFGDGFTIACDNLNTIYSWGKSEDFQLGYDLKFQDSDIVNGKKCRLNPTMVKKFDSKVVSMESGKTLHLY